MAETGASTETTTPPITAPIEIVSPGEVPPVEHPSCFSQFLKKLSLSPLFNLMDRVMKDFKLDELFKKLGEALSDKPVMTLILSVLALLLCSPIFVFILCTFITTVMTFFAFIVFEGTIITVISSVVVGIALTFLGIVAGSSFIFSVFYMCLQKVGLLR